MRHTHFILDIGRSSTSIVKKVNISFVGSSLTVCMGLPN